MSHQQSSHEIKPETEILAEVLEESVSPAASTDHETGTDQLTDIATLQLALEQAQIQAAANLDKAIRTQAEMENLKKRVQKDLDDERKYGLSKFAKEMLSVIDSLELGLQAVSGDSPEVLKFKEGSELTIKQFETVFAKFNIEILDPTGQPFNPELHQAMAMQPSADLAPGTVITVFQKGYTIHGRLLRPAMVVVAKAEDKPANSTKNDEQA
ncbi:nucleotide exchange factor GrpE [Methylomonas paludis]|uniref:Protein GrpE n=1 Tax=Methylomonas paludis TaxID=1173101 RepID=A0A975R8C0_9GAMM|nr:nucleotide exchange factor GrpE [Methylomonas paludis]QWF70220.1 nucleotide exchange factor GrpE [Methylomonas paludis]